ncbi:hypothetical protein IMSHALPRED_006477 [Imshaugia aleurites]|uniref:Uncharacterized protein n=1 Tax=Imshaugia aleurites TaxID=172621 RepID=A0A8H3FGD4_9LECA|nr:hypothetical protein IMSHALPRED_006477 [Imshaugia aleurites]
MSYYKSLDQLNLVNTDDWDDFEILELESARTVVLFHQLNNYRLRGAVDPEAAGAEWGAFEDSWNAVITNTPTGLGFVQRPGPYLWNAIFAYLANSGYALRQGLSQEEYENGFGLLNYEQGLMNVAFRRPPSVPNSISLPPWLQSWRGGR